MLRIHGHPHTLEYLREYGKRNREHLYTEHINDQGFVFQHHPERRASWLARYTRSARTTICAGWTLNTDAGSCMSTGYSTANGSIWSAFGCDGRIQSRNQRQARPAS